MRVLIAEDQFLLRDGLSRMLQALGNEVVAVVQTASELRRALLTEDVDVAIVDVRLPPTFTDEGLRIAIEARKKRPGLPVLVLSQYVETLYARELMEDRRGGVGYLLKDRVLNGDSSSTPCSRWRPGVPVSTRRSSPGSSDAARDVPHSTDSPRGRSRP